MCCKLIDIVNGRLWCVFRVRQSYPGEAGYVNKKAMKLMDGCDVFSE